MVKLRCIFGAFLVQGEFFTGGGDSMNKEEPIGFPPFRLDMANQELWRDETRLQIRAKTFAVLCYLVRHAGQLVTKEELIQAFWFDTVGTANLPKRSISELRHVLGDTAENPRYIETRPRYGYRFIAPLDNNPRAFPNSRANSQAPPQEQGDHFTSAPSLIVGRDRELSHLRTSLRLALEGKRQMVFVTGEPGIGKTTVIDAFLDNLSDAQNFWIGRGQCVEHFGVGEAYLPILEALTQIGREHEDQHFVELFLRHAPNWSSQMPMIFGQAGRGSTPLGRGVATRERMLRELAEVLELVTAEKPLLLVLEDLHWVDESTVKIGRAHV